MFTGIITGLGQIVDARPRGADRDTGLQLRMSAPEGYLADVALGDSIALNGACMTVTTLELSQNCFTIDISSESLAKTAGLDRAGTLVNLEKALRAHDRLGGHIVSGHVDGIGHVHSFEPVGDDWKELIVQAPKDLAPFLAYKGSIAIQGVSLTVNRTEDRENSCRFAVRLIPHTLAHTSLGQLQVGDLVNLEIDTVARYVARMLSLRR